MSINATLIGQIITFAVFVWVVMKYVWPPVMTAMHERQKRISDGLAAAERGARELNEAKQASENMLREAREQAQEILNKANKQAQETVGEAQATAREEGQRIVQAARAEVDQEIQRARESLRQEVSRLAVAGAERIISREIDAGAHEQLLEKLTAELVE